MFWICVRRLAVKQGKFLFFFIKFKILKIIFLKNNSYIAAMMRNTGTVFANDVNSDRLKGVKGNLARLGITFVLF